MLIDAHVPQTNPEGRNSCVPACLVMVLACQGVSVPESELCDLLDTQAAGTEVWNTLLLEQHIPGSVVRLESASIERLNEALLDGVPPIAFVATRHLPGWERETIHALVVVGVENDSVLVHDPALPSGPRPVPVAAFVAAWSELDFLTAFVTVRRQDSRKPSRSRARRSR
jgi:ABC-type bacteriocin/lantibiotic exporter with double-glycine peptidase domain